MPHKDPNDIWTPARWREEQRLALRPDKSNLTTGQLFFVIGLLFVFIAAGGAFICALGHAIYGFIA